MKSLRSLLWSAGVVSALLAGCNAILGNEVGVLGDLGPDASTASDGASDGFFVSDTPADQALPDAGPTFDGAVTCPPGQKNCAGACISIVNPNFGCGGASCNICPNEHSTKVDCIGLDGGSVCKATCADGFLDCNGISDGCETDISKSDNCGGCGNKCPTNPVKVCSKASNGVYGCVSTCPAPQVQCVAGGDCVDTSTAIDNCGGCGKPTCTAPTNADPICTGGVCGFKCKALFHLCGGQCVPDSTVTACGTSCKDCTPGSGLNVTPSCDLGACTYTCLAGTADCDNDLPSLGAAGDGCEVALATTLAHCGSCPNDCASQGPSNSTASCSNGTCHYQCNAGSHLCGPACVSDTSAQQCGTGCVDCAANAPANSTMACQTGSCAYTCATGFSDCNGDIGQRGAGDGCETNTTNDNANCGACNAPCTAGSTYCCHSACIDVAQTCP